MAGTNIGEELHPEQDDWFGQWSKAATQNLSGTGESPGIFGTGRYAVDPNASTLGNGDYWQNAAQQGYNAAGRRPAPRMRAGQMDTGQSDQFRNMQMGLAQQLQGQANGTGPSLAQNQLNAGMDRNIANAYAMAQATPNNAGVQRDLANQRASIGQQTSADSANLRLQEQQQAQNMLGQISAGARGQDLGVASDNLQASQQTGMANLQSQQQQNQMNQQAMQFYMSQGMSQDQAQAQLNMQMQNLKMQAYQGAAKSNETFYNNTMSGISSGMAAGSDERLKTKVVRHDVDVLPGVPVSTWEYKLLPGRRFRGVIAQDLEKVSPAHVLRDEMGMRFVDYSFAPGLFAEVAP